MDLRIVSGRALIGGEAAEVPIHVADGRIAEVGADAGCDNTLDATGLLVLPGIVDIHGDAFERQMMPRPGVDFALDIALAETDRQVIANGITTVFHSVTWSWEPGLRGADNARNMLATMEAMRPRLAADTKFHLRHETFNVDAESEVRDWLATHRIHALTFNDHMPPADAAAQRRSKIGQMAERSGLSLEDFLTLVARLRGRGDEVPDSIARLAKSANASGVPLVSHDDASVEQRRWFRSLGCRVSEFPTNIETAREAAASGDDVVLGAPNIVRGKSHMGWINASEMVARGICSILVSDYYYPASLTAAFRLVENGVALAKAWALFSEAPARAMKLSDRGRIEPGLRADLILVDTTVLARPRIAGALVAGNIVYLTEPRRISN